jgi:ribosomal-protein-alanine N-acetyltransferase
MFLEVAVDNVAALALYRSRGFEAVGRRPGYYSRPDGPIDAMIMRVDLNR